MRRQATQPAPRPRIPHDSEPVPGETAEERLKREVRGWAWMRDLMQRTKDRERGDDCYYDQDAAEERSRDSNKAKGPEPRRTPI